MWAHRERETGKGGADYFSASWDHKKDEVN